MIARKPQTAAPIQALFLDLDVKPAFFDAGKNLSIMQKSAWMLHDMALNVIPLGSMGESRKHPRGYFNWSILSRSPMRLNNHPGGMALLMACFDGACNVGVVCGDVSENLFVIDCEEMPIFWQYVQAMTERNIPVFAQKTARGAHIFLKGDKAVESFEVQRGDGSTLYEVRSNGLYVVVAPSYHPSGFRYQWLSAEGALSDKPFLEEIPRVTIGQIDFLVDAAGNSKALKGRHMPSPAMRKRKQYLSTGANTPEGSRESELFKQANYSRYMGIPREQAEQQLIPIAIQSGLPAKEAYHAIDSAYGYPQKAEQQNNPAGMVQKLQAFASSYTWAKKADKRVFEALIVRYSQDGFNYKNGRFSASSRNLAELTALHRKTVEKALKRLVGLECLITREGQNAREATVFQFTEKAICCKALPLFPTGNKDNHTGSGMQQNQIDLDLKDYHGIGDTGLKILRFLQANYRQNNEPATTAAIAQAIGVNRTTVHRHLTTDKQTGEIPALIQYRLVMKVGKGWIGFEDSTAEREMAQGLGVEGKSIERKEKHALERSLAVVSAMHKRVIHCDENHPAHKVTKGAKASDVLEAFSQQIAEKGQSHE